MKTIRQFHLYLGCVFAPLLIYFCLSGTWQVFRLNDVPKNEVSPMRSALHQLSSPHLHSAMPGSDPRVSHSTVFTWLSAVMALGMVLSAVLGVILAFRFTKRPLLVFLCLALGLAIPLLFLLMSQIS